jgi:glycosyltransferase involved in cell wall biosynthesis
MPKKKILYFSDLRPVKDGFAGGYSVITEGLCTALTKIGHEVKVVAMSYNAQPHTLPFSVIPMLDPRYLSVQLTDIIEGWTPDALVTALDIPWQIDIFPSIRVPIKYVAICPVEGEPLLKKWADGIAPIDNLFTLSEFGKRVLAQSGLRAKVLPVSSTMNNRVPSLADLEKVKSQIGLTGKFVTLKIADNHSRKNWAHTIEYWVKWTENDPNNVLYAVTRDAGVGWDLPELMEELGATRRDGINAWAWPDGREIRILSDIGHSDLLWVIAFADVLLMDTGNEGLGMPILDAFSTGLPVVGMNHTAISELLRDGRGILFDPGYRYRDVFGNVHRYYPGYETWSAAMTLAKNNPQLLKDTAIRAIEWFKGRTNGRMTEQLS